MRELSESPRASLAPNDRAHDQHPRLSGEIADRPMHLNIHLVQRFLHSLYDPRPLAD
jgi:hypothetical protein